MRADLRPGVAVDLLVQVEASVLHVLAETQQHAVSLGREDLSQRRSGGGQVGGAVDGGLPGAERGGGGYSVEQDVRGGAVEHAG